MLVKRSWDRVGAAVSAVALLAGGLVGGNVGASVANESGISNVAIWENGPFFSGTLTGNFIPGTTTLTPGPGSYREASRPFASEQAGTNMCFDVDVTKTVVAKNYNYVMWEDDTVLFNMREIGSAAPLPGICGPPGSTHGPLSVRNGTGKYDEDVQAPIYLTIADGTTDLCAPYLGTNEEVLSALEENNAILMNPYDTESKAAMAYLPKGEWAFIDFSRSGFCEPDTRFWFLKRTKAGPGVGHMTSDVRCDGQKCTESFNGKTVNLKDKKTRARISCKAQKALPKTDPVINNPADIPTITLTFLALDIWHADLELERFGTTPLWARKIDQNVAKRNAAKQIDEVQAFRCYDAPRKSGRYKMKFQDSEYRKATPAYNVQYCNAFRCRWEYQKASGPSQRTSKVQKTYVIKNGAILTK